MSPGGPKCSESVTGYRARGVWGKQDKIPTAHGLKDEGS